MADLVVEIVALGTTIFASWLASAALETSAKEAVWVAAAAFVIALLAAAIIQWIRAWREHVDVAEMRQFYTRGIRLLEQDDTVGSAVAIGYVELKAARQKWDSDYAAYVRDVNKRLYPRMSQHERNLYDHAIPVYPQFFAGVIGMYENAHTGEQNETFAQLAGRLAVLSEIISARN